MQPVNKAVRALDDDAIGRYLDQGHIELEVDGETVRLGPDDLEISSAGIEGWLVEQHRDVTVALDTQITDDLRTEGLARESVKRIQNLRKDAEFDVTDRIVVTYDGSAPIRSAVNAYAEWIRNETLALELQPSNQPTGEATQTFEIGDEHLTVGIQRVSRM
jgi:isoleucyl-tRNA synthetase